LVMLLPHGFEGMGPEHSSARLERYLQLCAEDNVQVAQPTTPAQIFHLLRRQAMRRWRKPLIVMTPKSLLRHKKVISSYDEFTTGGFQRILPDEGGRSGAVDRVMLCSGKIYFELDAQRETRGADNVAILRVEQLYPLTSEKVMEALSPFDSGVPVQWVQDAPENMGEWQFIQHHHGDAIRKRHPLKVVCRPESASPATGWSSSYKLEQQRLLAKAFE
jgi:2-oxoglutarate dehydrogenase E1 component